MHLTQPIDPTHAPQHPRLRKFAPWGRVAAVFVAALVLQIVVMDFNLSIYDESISLYGALRVLHGHLLYRDFWTMYPPGEFYLLAAAFRFLGVLAIWDRVIFIVANAIGAVAMLYILNGLTARVWLSRLATLLIVLWISARPSYAFPIYPSLALILVATACMLDRWRHGGKRPVLLAGVALGLSALFRHDLALYALLAAGIASVAHQVRIPKSQRDGAAWGDLVRLALTALLVVSPVLILLLIRVPLHDLYYDLIYVPGVIYPKVRALHFPNLSEIRHAFRHPYPSGPVVPSQIEYQIVFVPALVVFSSLALLLPRRHAQRFPSWKTTGLLCLILLTALLFVKGLVRVSPLHMAPAVVPALMLLACLLSGVSDLPWLGRACVLFAAVWASVCVYASVQHDCLVFARNLRSMRGTEPGQDFYAACHPPEALSRARCVFLPPDEQRAISFLQSETSPADKIFVGVPRYDILHLSDIEIYFISKRDAGTKWYDLHPGVQTTAPIQSEMIRELDQNHVSFIVRDNLIYPEEPNQSAVSSGVNLLGDYITTNYAPQRAFGSIEVLQRTTPFTPAGTDTQ